MAKKTEINKLIGCDAKEFELTNYFRKKETGGFMELSLWKRGLIGVE